MHALCRAAAVVPQAQELLSFRRSARTNVPRSASHGFRRGDLWALGISGDHPVLLLRAGTAEQTGLLRFVISAQALWRQRGISVDLVITHEGTSGYIEPVREQLLEVQIGKASGRERVCQ